MTTTEDLASLVREVGGDKVSVDAIARGYQDPHFVEPKPSFILKLHDADLLVVIGRELEIGWLPPLLTQSRNAKIQPGSPGYLDASRERPILELPDRPDHARDGRRAPAGQPALLARPGQRPHHRQGDAAALGRLSPADQAYFEQRYADFDRRLGEAREAMGRGDGAVQGHEDRDLPSVLAELHRSLRAGRDWLRRAEARDSAVALAHAGADAAR